MNRHPIHKYCLKFLLNLLFYYLLLLGSADGVGQGESLTKTASSNSTTLYIEEDDPLVSSGFEPKLDFPPNPEDSPLLVIAAAHNNDSSVSYIEEHSHVTHHIEDTNASSTDSTTQKPIKRNHSNKAKSSGQASQLKISTNPRNELQEKDKRRKMEKRRKRKKLNGNHSSQREANTAKQNRSKIRLPSSVIPVHYVLRLHPHFNSDFLVLGSVEIEVEVREVTIRVKLHAYNISVNKKSVKVSLLKSYKQIPIQSVKLNPRRQFLTIKLGRKLKPGRVYVIKIDFSYHLNEEAKGFYKASYVDEQGDKRWIAATQFWPSDARRAFPCFDEPGMKSTFDVHIARSENMTSLSNMPIVRNYRTKEKPEWIWDQFATTANMSTYLLAFAITDFSSTTNDKSNGTRLAVWTRKSKQNRTSLPLQVGTSSLKFYEDYFDLDFPLPKIDMVALPKMSFSAMENWGLITYRESSLVHDSSTASAMHSLSVSVLVAHEVAHQWFGNLVTFEWWNDLWLNEGFATYMSFVAVQDAEPTWRVLDQFVSTRLQEVMALDALPSSHPVNTPVKDPGRINQIFDSIPYNKGASIVRMMRHFLSESTFRKGLKTYLQHFKYRNTRQDDLWNFLTKSAHQDESLPFGVSVKQIMDTWTMQAGYPLLHVERYDNGTAFLTQKRFLLGKLSSQQKKKATYKWWIPITFTTQKRPSFTHTRAQTWLRQEDKFLRVTGLPPRDKWVIFNLQHTGYYRVNYDIATWYLLIDQLNTNHKIIHVTNRAQLIDDSLNLARAGMLPYNVALELVTYLKHETDYIPWKAGLRNLNYIKEMLRKNKNYGILKEFLLDLFDPLVKSVGFQSKPNESMQMKLIRSEMISWCCQMEHPYCHSLAQKLSQNLLENSTNIDENVSGEVLCSVVQNGNELIWESIWKAYRYSNTIDQQSKYLKALGCTRYIWLLNRYLDLIKDPDSGVLRQDGAQLYKHATQTPAGTYVAWDMFRTSWNHFKVFSDFTYFVAPGIIEVITDGFNTHHQHNELQNFKEKVKSDDSSSKNNTHYSNPILPALNNALAKCEVNLKWMKANYAVITDWFKAEGYSLNMVPRHSEMYSGRPGSPNEVGGN